MSPALMERLRKAIPTLAERFGTPCLVYDEIGIRQTVRGLLGAFKNAGLDFKEYYAVKAWPHPVVLKILKEMGCGFDCSSISELRKARAAGATPDDIMFTSNNTSQAEFKEAQAYGGCILNLDDEIFIDKVKPFPKLISFRLNPGDYKTGDEVNSIIGEPKDSKYGVPIERIVDVYKLARNAGAEEFGLHTMVCSNDRNYKHMVSTVSLLLKVAADLRTQAGICLKFINMGGGIGIPYRPMDQTFDIEGLAKESRKLVDAFEAEYGYRPKLLMESGRYITGPHGALVNRVINVYEKYKKYAGVEVAMPGVMRVGMYPNSAYHQCTILGPDGIEPRGELYPITVAGSICENCDVLARDMPLPPVREGDFVITHDAGAHGSAMGFNYNGRTRPQELMIGADGVIRRITRAETEDDLDRRYENIESLDLSRELAEIGELATAT
jgi:diaminopimelate decarboxylase